MLDSHMSAELDRYITGNYGMNQFDGTEEKCVKCLSKADEESTLQSISDGVVEMEGELLCLECLKQKLEKEHFIDWEELVEAIKSSSL
jgi:hypothetical protein